MDELLNNELFGIPTANNQKIVENAIDSTMVVNSQAITIIDEQNDYTSKNYDTTHQVNNLPFLKYFFLNNPFIQSLMIVMMDLVKKLKVNWKVSLIYWLMIIKTEISMLLRWILTTLLKD